ncbi:MAG TPA: anti-sigma factor [Candidatus Rubrimentiphilum sp.]|nr:anti-sigma factor [Candidatus Rubrimentiphilum sp.]
MTAHDAMLDDVAVYALGALPADEAAAVRAHLATCAECTREYQRLKPAVDAVAYSAEACADRAAGAVVPNPRLKARIMNTIRPQAIPRLANVGEMRAVRPIVWPAYAVAAACLAIALITSVFNISLNEQLHQSQLQVAQFATHARLLNRQVALQREELADLTSSDSQHYAVEGGEVVRRGNRLYIAMQTMAMPPRGKVYQAWIMRPGATRMTPSVTFMPDRGGIAVLPIPVQGTKVVEVAVSMEPDGGSKQPTSKPTFVVKLT